MSLINPYWDSVLAQAAILAIAAVGLHITMKSGQFSLVHGATMGVGSYAAAMVAKEAGMPLVAALLAGTVVAASLGAIVAVIVTRLNGLLLGIATLAIGALLEILANVFFPGGAAGYSGVPIRVTLPLAALMLVLVVLFTLRWSRTAAGLGVLSVGADTLLAESLGLRTVRLKVLSFAIGGGLAGLAGGLNAQFLGVVAPGDLGFAREIDLVTFVIVGGAGTPLGAVLGAFALTIGGDLLRVATLDRGWIFGLLLALTILVRPSGVLSRRPIKFGHKREADRVQDSKRTGRDDTNMTLDHAEHSRHKETI